jgi:transcriptional regulator with XRE-family HTH domain
MAEIIPLVQPTRRPSAEPLWRHVLGKRLRTLRERQGRTLTEVAERAGISPQYLSEIERGLKEPSSEMIAAVTGALGSTLVDLSGQIADELRRQHVLDLTRERELEFQRHRTNEHVLDMGTVLDAGIVLDVGVVVDASLVIHPTEFTALLLAA